MNLKLFDQRKFVRNVGLFILKMFSFNIASCVPTELSFNNLLKNNENNVFFIGIRDSNKGAEPQHRFIVSCAFY